MTEIQMSASREEYRAMVAEHSEAIEVIHEKFMEVVKRICQQHDDKELSGANAKLKIGLANAKQKRLIVNLIGNPLVTDGSTELPGRSKTLTNSFKVKAATAKHLMSQLTEEVNSIFTCVPQASVSVYVEISADFPQGDTHQFIMAGYENTTKLEFKNTLVLS
jgi:hypothetical protein